MKKLSALVLTLLMALCIAAFASAETTTLTYESRGVQVPATLVTPDGVDSYPVVIMAHGHGGSRDENVGFAALADALAEQGIASFRMDFPGCGESTESFQENTLSNMKADVLAGLEYVKSNLNVTKVGLFGYSMGGRIVLELLAEDTNPDAVVLLAPAADNDDLKNLFGGEEAYASMYETAKADGYAVFTTIYGQVQELSTAWFEDLTKYDDVKASAAAAWQGPAEVIWGTDDEAVSPSVSAAVAEALNATTVEATGEGHGYGFYSEDDTVRNTVANAVASFFAENLK